MAELTSGYETRRARQEGNKRRGSSKIKSTPRYGLKAVLLTVLLPFLLTGWGVAKTFLYLCAGTCSYSDKTVLADIGLWVFLVLSIGCLLAILYYASESLAHQEGKAKAIISTAVAGLLAGFFYFGAFQDILASIVIKIMY